MTFTADVAIPVVVAAAAAAEVHQSGKIENR